jgi:WD40 repeat protein
MGLVTVWDVARRREYDRFEDPSTGFFGCIAFNPQDRTTLALGGQDGTMQLWEVGNGRPPRTLLPGHTGAVKTVAFSPDGERLASASIDGTVKLWNPASGQELCTLVTSGAPVVGVAFSRDGTRLASSSHDKNVTVWDARPLTSDVRAEGEALALVESLFAKRLPRAEVIARIRHSKTLSETAREKALALVPPYWKGVVHQKAFRWVDSIFAQGLRKAEVLAKLGADRSHGEEVRQEARFLAERWPEGLVPKE